ncbi:unnamed protein product [Caenorhabditis bovis]|uniref:Uncharacterized protein n=1 Tax=Caenorhabditis bovis TaxID=2654633 RepID=A0A8S1FFJ4_9PELO|nr:unnamed protein product [Caenorhabditis bovis]
MNFKLIEVAEIANLPALLDTIGLLVVQGNNAQFFKAVDMSDRNQEEQRQREREIEREKERERAREREKPPRADSPWPGKYTRT